MIEDCKIKEKTFSGKKRNRDFIQSGVEGEKEKNRTKKSGPPPIDIKEEEKEYGLSIDPEKGLDPGKYSFAMDEVKIQRRFKVRGTFQKEENIDIPEFIAEASKFLGQPVTKLFQSTSTNRLFRDATEDLPPFSYQYFPVIDEDEDYAAIVAVKFFELTGEKVLKFSFDDYKGKEIIQEISFNTNEFAEPEKVAVSISTIANYLYGPLFHKPCEEGITIRVFAKKPIAGSSFMYAMMMALMGTASGGFYSGGFTYNAQKNVFELMKMSEDVINRKVKQIGRAHV